MEHVDAQADHTRAQADHTRADADDAQAGHADPFDPFHASAIYAAASLEPIRFVAMIRDARFVDVPAIVGLLEDGYARSIFADGLRGEIDIAETKRLVVAGIHRHGGTNGGATWVQVTENDGVLTGLIYGTLIRTYSVGTTLTATDLFWLTNALAEPEDAADLMRGMIAWAWRSPHVIDVTCGVTKVIQDPEPAMRLLGTIGMQRHGGIMRMERPQ